ncbi:MAG: hypothetical protein ABEJ40_09850, partial [Haloarculaceae archaeon]
MGRAVRPVVGSRRPVGQGRHLPGDPGERPAVARDCIGERIPGVAPNPAASALLDRRQPGLDVGEPLADGPRYDECLPVHLAVSGRGAGEIPGGVRVGRAAGLPVGRA